MKNIATKRETVSKEVKEYMQNNASDMAISHLEAWKDRYFLIGLKQLKNDLYVNHDPSGEIGEVEREIGRQLNDKEKDFIVENFNKAVIRVRS